MFDVVGAALGVGPPDEFDLSGHPIGLNVGCVGGFSVSSFVVADDDDDAAADGNADFCGA